MEQAANIKNSPYLLPSDRYQLITGHSEGVKKSILTEGERGYWKSFRAVPFHRQLLTLKNLSHSRSLAEPYDLCLSKAAILKLWRYLRSTDSPNFFTASDYLFFLLSALCFHPIAPLSCILEHSNPWGCL